LLIRGRHGWDPQRPLVTKALRAKRRARVASWAEERLSEEGRRGPLRGRILTWGLYD